MAYVRTTSIMNLLYMNKIMKKIFVAIVLTISTLVCAQSHMNFRGIKINGTLAEFVKQMELKDFKVFSTDEHSVLMFGRHHGLTVVAEVMATPVSETVYKVVITYPTSAALWHSLYMDYGTIRTKIEKTYGSPSEVLERFESPYSEDNKPFEALREGKATFMSKYITVGGGIIVQLLYAEPHHEVQSIYWDTINEELYQTESMSGN